VPLANRWIREDVETARDVLVSTYGNSRTVIPAEDRMADPSSNPPLGGNGRFEDRSTQNYDESMVIGVRH